MANTRLSLLTIALVASGPAGSAVLAQGGSPSAEARPADPMPCSQAASPDVREAIAAAEALFEASWQTIGSSRATSFRTKPEPVNPLAVRDPKAEPAAPAITGLIHAESVGCAYFPAHADTAVWFVGTAVRFHEAGKWSRPLPQGLLMGVRTRRIDGVVKAVVDPGAPTVVLPDAVLAKPEAKDVPPLSPAVSAKSKDKKR